ncbi:hypothetical protein [Acidipropionibacterium jensenii]|uniref:hypothetical protein n=1 Tax=Acidipropionibacterium jensenii TaxID=1749 RepID=UPI00214B6722|nr:hypothetical protein [Acidipropionibacterium jensenii]
MASSPVPQDPRISHSDAEAVLGARADLGPSMEPAVVDSFAAKVTAEIQRQVASEREAQLSQTSSAVPAGGRIAVAIISVVMSIPLTAVMMGTNGGLLGVLICWVGLVVVNVALAMKR